LRPEQHIVAKGDVEYLTNQALLALMATVFMSVYGSKACASSPSRICEAHYLAGKLPLVFDAPFFMNLWSGNGKLQKQLTASCYEEDSCGLRWGVFIRSEGFDAVVCDRK